jgi:ABC-type transporter Mla subunit MlaD
MAVQDLTPQLRTRLSRVERAVGWFVILATLLLLAGFGYYVHHVATRKGWFLTKIPYFTYVRNAEGLHVGDPVRLMGFEVGNIIDIQPESADNEWARKNGFNVFVKFQIKSPYYGYLWSDTKVKVAAADLLGKRVLELSRGLSGIVTVIEQKGESTMLLSDPSKTDYVPLTDKSSGFWVKADEPPALTERFEALANQIQGAMPNILALTNQIAVVLSNSASLTAHLDETTLQLRPTLANLTLISARLTNGPGALGEWLIPTNIDLELRRTLASAGTALQTAGNTLTNADTNLVMVAASLNQTLLNLASLTSNLNHQVESNDHMLSEISHAVVHADELVQGLKRHWLLRSAFKEKPTNAPAPPALRPTPGAGKWR